MKNKITEIVETFGQSSFLNDTVTVNLLKQQFLRNQEGIAEKDIDPVPTNLQKKKIFA